MRAGGRTTHTAHYICPKITMLVGLEKLQPRETGKGVTPTSLFILPTTPDKMVYHLVGSDIWKAGHPSNWVRVNSFEKCYFMLQWEAMILGQSPDLTFKSIHANSNWPTFWIVVGGGRNPSSQSQWFGFFHLFFIRVSFLACYL